MRLFIATDRDFFFIFFFVFEIYLFSARTNLWLLWRTIRLSPIRTRSHSFIHAHTQSRKLCDQREPTNTLLSCVWFVFFIFTSFRFICFYFDFRLLFFFFFHPSRPKCLGRLGAQRYRTMCIYLSKECRWAWSGAATESSDTLLKCFLIYSHFVWCDFNHFGRLNFASRIAAIRNLLNWCVHSRCPLHSICKWMMRPSQTLFIAQNTHTLVDHSHSCETWNSYCFLLRVAVARRKFGILIFIDRKR